MFARYTGPFIDSVSDGDEVPIPTRLLSESMYRVLESKFESPANVDVPVPFTVRLPENVPSVSDIAPDITLPATEPPVMVAPLMVAPVIVGFVITVFVSLSIF